MPHQPHERVLDADEAIRRYYEDGRPSEIEGFRDITEPVSPADERVGKPEHDEETARLSGGDADLTTQGTDVGTEAAGGSNPSPDQDLVDEIGKAVGVTYQDNEPLKFGDKIGDRDRERWELNPASSEDYEERGPTAPSPARRSSSSRKKSSTAPKRPGGKRSTT
jgi:hypothetical protein